MFEKQSLLKAFLNETIAGKKGFLNFDDVTYF